MLMHTKLILNVLAYFYLKKYMYLDAKLVSFLSFKLVNIFSADTADDSYEFL